MKKILLEFLKFGYKTLFLPVVKKGNSFISSKIPKTELSKIHVNNAKLLTTREELLSLLPIGGVVAELGVDQDTLQAFIEDKVTFRTFFQKANIHPNAHMIKGVVCGYRIEDIEDEFELYKQCRRMEKLIDELAKGRKMEKILRKEKK
ncbi:DUF2200 domain-containing protein [Flavobacteriaceae bacterium]|jgi:hypothetical protein|nr:DUF2200 domain-containing protein [Flavobacteriaceae bacterium]MDA7724210.1 DUF2200 domain-containing protein [Flavobacteriaceae bacterium]MDA7849351.1 DUF2200 domain-containing protein [Flavobacteriaceae bacterium]